MRRGSGKGGRAGGPGPCVVRSRPFAAGAPSSVVAGGWWEGRSWQEQRVLPGEVSALFAAGAPSSVICMKPSMARSRARFPLGA